MPLTSFPVTSTIQASMYECPNPGMYVHMCVRVYIVYIYIYIYIYIEGIEITKKTTLVRVPLTSFPVASTIHASMYECPNPGQTSICMCICVCAPSKLLCMSVPILAHENLMLYIYIYIYIYTHTHTYIYIYRYMYLRAVQLQFENMLHICVYMYVCMYVCMMYVCTCVYMYVRMHVPAGSSTPVRKYVVFLMSSKTCP